MSAPKPYRLAITAGEPAGIGPDCCLALTQLAWPVELVFIADPEMIEQRARTLGLPVQIQLYDAGQMNSHQPGQMTILPVTCPHSVHCGQPDPANAAYVLETLKLASQRCLSHEFDALVTAPVHKGVINDAGITFTGHTEYLQDLARAPEVVMMLATSGLRVALVTTHLPLKQVSKAITPAKVENIITITHRSLIDYFAIPQPRLLVCGLNPHAGENGHLGSEDDQIIAPVLERLRQQSMQIMGPLPADTLFIPKYLEQADVVIAMYHDQGLPVLKYKGFGQAVNITLGLPYIRTSVDHGTAVDLAGSGLADAGSLKAAIEYAVMMLTNSRP